MTAEHTPGPWVAIRTSCYWEIVTDTHEDNGPWFVGDVFGCDPENPDGGLQEANARLIAAAPDMLEALVAASALLARHGIGATQIDAAIAKARE